MSKLTHTAVDYGKKWLAFCGIALLSFGCYLDYTVVNIALPTIQQELHANITALQWVMNIYFLALCVCATIIGRLGDSYGRRYCFYLGVILFGIASIIAGFAPNINWLIFGRLLQGIGAATVFPLSLSLLPLAFPKKQRGLAVAWLGSVGGMALALGPVLGGIIVTHLGWRWIFFINIPLIFIGYCFAMNSVKESISEEQHALDWLGMLFLALTMIGIVLGLIMSQTHGWDYPATIALLSLALVAIGCLIKVEKKHPYPLIDLKDFTKILFYGGVALCFLAGMLSAVSLFFDPLYLQITRHQTAQTTGFILFAIPVAVFFMAFLVERLVHHLTLINTLLLAFTFGVVACLMQIFFSAATPVWYIILAFICLGSMWAMGNTITVLAIQTAVNPNRVSVAMGTLVTMFNIGGSIGLALAVVVYHIITANALKGIVHLYASQLNAVQITFLKNLIYNPAKSLQITMNSLLENSFQHVFICGFTGVMWLLLIVASFILISLLAWKALTKTGK